jgi:predicted ATP-dependent endonuclease of OLD family
MKLDRVEIVNFRSIKSTIVKFNTTCRVLVGINESGKSNILDALALLRNDSTPVRKTDLREALPAESPIEESYVRFVFRFEKNESDALFEKVSGNLLTTTDNPRIVSKGQKHYSLKDFCATCNQGLYSVDILKESKYGTYWSFGNTYKLADGWKKPTSECPEEYFVELEGTKCQLSQYALARVKDLRDVPDNYLEDARIEDLFGMIGESIINITKENLPNTLVWVYNEANLLPDSVEITQFRDNPDTCVPLKHMFALAGINDIATSLSKAREGTDNQFQNYLNRVAKKTTTHFRNVWKDYKGIEFSLALNADRIVPGIKEKNVLDFARRSDGFKRFVTFLLMISVNVKTYQLRNTLLLIDEPETSLHPSGSRYFRDELIRISRTNYVVFSTHSVFMIDSGDISRHYIVRKRDEITSIEVAQSSNIADEEVLYNALGHSVFAVLREKNIIFEGWRDKKLFQVALSGASSQIRRKFKDVGICHVKGVGTIKAITPLMELAKRKCVILSDNDMPSITQQKVYKREKGYGRWCLYKNVDPSIEAVTREDFVKNDFIVKQINSVLSDSTMPTFDQATLPEKKAKLAAIKKWLIDNDVTESQAKDILEEIKSSIFEKLKPRDIEDAYTKLLQAISL